MTGGALTEAQLLDSLGDWSNIDALADQLNANNVGNWTSGFFGSGGDALTIANRGPFAADLRAPGTPGHVVMISPNAVSLGTFTVADTAGGVTYQVDSNWIETYVAGGVWQQ